MDGLKLGKRTLIFGDISCGPDETKIELFGHRMTIVTFGGKRGKLANLKEHHPNCEKHLGGGSIMLWGCFAAGGTGALHKIDGIMRKRTLMWKILKQTSQDISQEVKALGANGIFQMDNDPKAYCHKLVTAKWLKWIT
ncbi:hypothetical protein NFI96_033116 [Prochilodus magdalenae]|nr:hypothetical protein NFI96_033116 [Prochilodus magdalenae]